MAEIRSSTTEKMKRIQGVLIEHKDGLWIREIQRETGYSPGSIYYILKIHMSKDVEITRISKGDRFQTASYIALVKLKS